MHRKPNLYYAFIWLFLCLSFVGKAQVDSTFKTSKPKFVFQIDIRNSFIRNNSDYQKMIYGCWAGLDYAKKHIYSLGLYTTNNPFTPLSIIYKHASTGAVIKQYYNFEMYFASLGYQYVFFNKHKVLMSIPLEVGFGLGRAYVERHWFDNSVENSYAIALYSKFIPVQLGYTLEWKATPWFGVNAQIGYRKSLFTDLLNDNKNINYDGIYYTYGIRLYFGRIYADSKKAYHSIK